MSARQISVEIFADVWVVGKLASGEISDSGENGRSGQNGFACVQTSVFHLEIPRKFWALRLRAPCRCSRAKTGAYFVLLVACQLRRLLGLSEGFMEPVWLRNGGAPRSAMRQLSCFGHDPAFVRVICVEPFAYCAELNALKDL